MAADMRNMLARLLDFCRDEQGQDLVEYAICVAFVALAAAAIFLGDASVTAQASAPHK